IRSSITRILPGQGHFHCYNTRKVHDPKCRREYPRSGSPETVPGSVRALGAAVLDLRTGRHEPDEPRGSRPDLWGAAGETPAAYPANGGVDGESESLGSMPTRM